MEAISGGIEKEGKDRGQIKEGGMKRYWKIGILGLVLLVLVGIWIGFSRLKDSRIL